MKKALLLIALCAHFGTSLLAQPADSVTITGKIAGYDPNEHELFAKVNVYDFVIDDGVGFVTQVGEDGQFRINAMVHEQQTIDFRYGNQGLILFAKPGDSIWIEFPAFAFMSQDYNLLSEDFVKIGGDEGELNSLIISYGQEMYRYRRELLKEEPLIIGHIAYKQFVKTYKAAQLEFLKKFVEGKTDKQGMFLRWAEAEILFDCCKMLLDYPLLNPKDTCPIEWYDFIHDVPMDKLDVALTSFAYYINSLSAVLRTRFRKSEPLASMKKRGEPTAAVMMDSICANTQGLARDAILTIFFAHAAKYPTTKPEHQELLPRYFDLVKHERCRAHIKKEYGLTPPEALPPDFLAKLESAQIPDSLKEVLPLILEKHKGKVVVLDFWATWCGPCMAELERFYPAFIPKFKEEEVAFVFLAGKSPKAKWQQTVNGFQFKGDHYLLTDNQDAVLKQLFQISGIPHHVLIDKEGKVIDPNLGLSDGMGEAEIRKFLGK